MNALTRHFPAEDDFVRDLPGELSHLVHITATDLVDTTAAIGFAILAFGAPVASSRISRCGDRLQQRLIIGGADPSQVRALARHLADLPGIDHVKVEHVISRPRGNTDRLPLTSVCAMTAA